MPLFFDKLLAIMRRDLLSGFRYRSAVGLQALAALAELAGFFYLARTIGPGFRPDGLAYFPFLLVGSAFWGFFVSGTSNFLTSVREAQAAGTMEVLMTTPTSAPLYMLLGAVSSFAARIVHLALYLAVGFGIFGIAIARANLPALAILFIVTFAVALAIALFTAAAQVAVQKGGAVLWLLGTTGWFLTGAMFPVNALPPGLRQLGAIIPITQTFTGFRMALLNGASIVQLGPIIVVLGTYAVVLLPLSLLLFSHVLHNARVRGTLSQY